MYVYTCNTDFESMMTCIYEAWASKVGHRNIRMELQPVEQTELFCEYVIVEADNTKAGKVIEAIKKKISWQAYKNIYYAAMSCAADRLDAIYRFLLIGFHVGAHVTDMLTNPYTVRIFELSRRTGNEAHYFREFARFVSMDQKVYVSHIEPKCNVITMVAEHFADRMPSEYWIMVDDVRRIAVVHPKDGAFYLTSLLPEEYVQLHKIDQYTDCYTILWKEFFHTIGIEKRKNPKCQRTMMPIWYRKHVTEFQ